MRVSFVWIVGAALLAGCGSPTSETAAPFLRGVITSRAPVRIDSLHSFPSMFVDGWGMWPASERCAAQAHFGIGSSTKVFRHGQPVDTGQLVVGQQVAVWTTGIVLESCPPQTGAAKVVLEDPR
jgi:hypothetical protein